MFKSERRGQKTEDGIAVIYGAVIIYLKKQLFSGVFH